MSCGVPLQLLRDYNVMQALLRCLPSGCGTVQLRTLAELLREDGGYMQHHTLQMVQQGVGVAVSKVLDSAQKHLSESEPDACVIEYIRATKSKRGGGEVKVNTAGSTHLAAHIRWLLGRMEMGDVDLAMGWHTSKSARQKAKRSAISQMMHDEDQCPRESTAGAGD